MYANIAHMCMQTRLHIYVHTHTHTHTRQNWIFEEIHQELNPVTCKLKLKWQARWVDQTQYPMIVVASLSAVPQSCRTPLLIKRREERKRKKGKFYIYLDVTHTPGRSRVNPERQEEGKSGHKRRAKGQNSAGGERNERTSRTNLSGETGLTKTEHTPKPHDTLRRSTEKN